MSGSPAQLSLVEVRQVGARKSTGVSNVVLSQAVTS